MLSLASLVTQVDKWNQAVVPVVKQVAKLLDTGEEQFDFFPSLGDLCYAVVDQSRNVAYIDAVPQDKGGEFGKEMRSLQTTLVREYPGLSLIINLERITPKLTELFSYDLIKLAMLTHRVKHYYIISSHHDFTDLVAAAMNIHDRIVDKEKFHHYETLEALPVIIKQIKQGQ